MLPARLRAGCGWSDACILNISSRGLLIHSTRAAVQGSTIELWHGDRMILARVVWRKGTRAGLHADDRIPVEDLILSTHAAPIPRIAADGRLVERRKRPRPHADSRLRGRAIEFAGVVLIAATLATGAFAMVQQALARPLAYVHAALGG